MLAEPFYRFSPLAEGTDPLSLVFGSSATGTILGPEPHALKMKGSIFDTSAEIIDESRGGKCCPLFARFFGNQ